jgi:hypothetical protein
MPDEKAEPLSISVIQWLLNADATSHSPTQRLTRFFTTLHAALRNPSRAVFQFYPSSDDQVHMITSAAQRAGFGGGLVVDYPNSRKARKMYLVLMVGSQEIPKGLDGEEASVAGKTGVGAERQREEVRNERRRRKEEGKSRKGKKEITGKDWIMKKKELYRVRGKEGYVCSYSVENHRRASAMMELTPQCPERFQVYRSETKGQVLVSSLKGSVCIIMHHALDTRADSHWWSNAHVV